MTDIAKKRRWTLVPCPDYDVPAMESWLEEQAMQGLFLSKEDGFFLGLACFETGSPKRVRYRLDAIPKEKAFSEFDENKQAAIALAGEMGWEFVAEWREFLIYRCDDARLPELNTDPAVQALSLKRVQKALADRVFSTCYYLFLYPILLSVLREPEILLGVLTLGTLRLLALILVTVLLAWGAVRDWRRLRKLRKHLQAGGRIEHTNGWRDEKNRCLAGKIVRPILTAVWLVLLVSFLAAPRLHPDAPAIDVSEAPLPTLSDFADFPVDETDDGYELTLAETHDLLAPEIYNLYERSGGAIYVADYYELRAPWLAGWLAKDLLRYNKRRDLKMASRHEGELTQIALPEDLDADMARCYQNSFGEYRLLLQKGEKLLSATFWWPEREQFPAGQIARTLLDSMESSDPSN